MEFKFISECLYQIGLDNPNLELLTPDAKLYSTLLFQPCGNIGTEDESGGKFVKNINRDESIKKFRSFFSLANKNDVDLAVTPEYSCPWEVINDLIKTNDFPKENKIWVIGCESINQNDLKEIINENDQIKWIYEDKLNTEEENKFFDPLFYFFKTTEFSSGELKNVIVIQFKTHQMGGTDFETDNLIFGKYIYVFRNNVDSIHLATLICSDALNFDVTKLRPSLHTPHLILHIQLNKEPFNPKFSKYRKDYYQNRSINKEFISLNWARNSKMDNELFSKYGGSAFYTKSDNLNLQDEKICNNHKNGLYYSNWGEVYASIFFFNYDEFVFEFENTKVSQACAPVQNQNNTGPRMGKSYEWNDDNWKIVENLNDGLCDFCSEIHDDFFQLLSGDLNPINIERLIALSIGEATYKDWLHPKKLNSFQISGNDENSELNRRFTFFQDPDVKMKMEKTKSMMNFGKLCSYIIKNDGNFPNNFNDLKSNCSIKYKPGNDYENHLFNLYSDEKPKASVAFIGQNTEQMANSIFNNMSGLFNESHSGKRVVVWFENIKGEIEFVINKDIPTITENITRSRNSYLKRGQ